MRTPSPTRLAAALLAALLLACETPAPAPTPAAAPAPPVRETGQLVFWEIARGAHTTAAEAPPAARAWLLGSVHVGQGEGLDPAIDRALAGADVLVLEVPPEDLQPERAVASVLQHGLLPDGTTLRDELPEATYDALERYFEDRELEWQGLQMMKPWVVLLQVVGEGFEQGGMTAEGGVESGVLAQAGERPVRGLETIDEQMALFDSLPLTVQIEALDDLLADGAEAEGAAEIGRGLIDAWRAGDLDAIEAAMLADLGTDAELDRYYEAMYFERNVRMAAGIVELLDEGGSFFVAVGAGHTVGGRGIPALLRAQGLLVRRVPKTVDDPALVPGVPSEESP